MKPAGEAMDTFRAHHADILDPAQQPRVIALLREHGLVTFTGITSRIELACVARRLMSIRPHRDAGPDGVTVITGTGTAEPGYAAFTEAELNPHTDGTSIPDLVPRAARTAHDYSADISDKVQRDPKAVGGQVVLGRATSLRADDRPGRAQAAKRLLTVPEEAKLLQDAVTDVLKSATMGVASRDLAHAERDNQSARFRGRSIRQRYTRLA
jgi:hypothetical protein